MALIPIPTIVTIWDAWLVLTYTCTKIDTLRLWLLTALPAIINFRRRWKILWDNALEKEGVTELQRNQDRLIHFFSSFTFFKYFFFHLRYFNRIIRLLIIIFLFLITLLQFLDFFLFKTRRDVTNFFHDLEQTSPQCHYVDSTVMNWRLKWHVCNDSDHRYDLCHDIVLRLITVDYVVLRLCVRIFTDGLPTR